MRVLPGPFGWPLRDQLHEIGSDLDGPLRIHVKKEVLPDDALIYDWPLESPIDSYVVENDDVRSFRLDDSESVSRLRRLRDIALAEAAVSPGYFFGAIAIKPSESYVPGLDEVYLLIMRDELPFGDTSGMWRP